MESLNRPFKIVFFFTLVFFYCHKMPESVGKARDVVVVASEMDTAFIKENLQIYHYVPQYEPYFIFVFVSDTMLKNVKQFHSLFLCGSLKDDFIYELLNEEARVSTLKDTFNLFKVNDLWSKNQTVTILAVSEPSFIKQGITKYRKMIKKILEESYYKKVKSSFYSKEMDRNIKNHLKRFGWSMDIPAGWMIDSTHKEKNFIYVHTHYPDRIIFLYKEKGELPASDSLAIEKRNNITKMFYGGDYVLKDMTIAERIEFKGMKGLRLKGVWQNDSLVAGGPFLTYFLTSGDSLYVIDGMLFLPGERKTDYIIALEVMMNSLQKLE
ncbi:MAG: DUF4837 family protein [candidate division WOR-3 bacterium]|nr:DUF4837 family protein [candidate division WOR-3 bacterium]